MRWIDYILKSLSLPPALSPSMCVSILVVSSIFSFEYVRECYNRTSGSVLRVFYIRGNVMGGRIIFTSSLLRLFLAAELRRWEAYSYVY